MQLRKNCEVCLAECLCLLFIDFITQRNAIIIIIIIINIKDWTL
jgi:hypothetical protein